MVTLAHFEDVLVNNSLYMNAFYSDSVAMKRLYDQIQCYSS